MIGCGTSNMNMKASLAPNISALKPSVRFPSHVRDDAIRCTYVALVRGREEANIYCWFIFDFGHDFFFDLGMFGTSF
jgi:hypothetical protein